MNFNPNEDVSLVGKVIGGFVVGIIAALGIGLACLLTSKIGWDGLGRQISSYAADSWFSLLVFAVVIAIFIFFQKKKDQIFKDVLKAEAFVISFAVSMFICLLITISLFYSPPPDKYIVDYGVNWALANEYGIEWRNSKVNIFDSYKLTNQYRETVGSEKHFVYDFEAQCPLLVYRPLDGSGRVEYAQFRGNSNSTMITLSGSVTLVKKGVDWYPSKTIRVH